MPPVASSALKMEMIRHVPPKLTGLHGLLFQKIKVLINTAVRT
jgi:hypothetical protein